MKFVCERCQTKYSIADEKVRGKVLKVRCKSCSNVITVREQPTGTVKAAEAPAPTTVHDSGRTAITSPAELQRRHAEATRAMDGARGQATAPARRKSGPLAAIPAEALNAPGAPKAPPPVGRPPAPTDDPIWYLAVDGHQTGPFTAAVLADKVLGQPKNADVHVWNPGLGDWRPPAAVPEIHALVEKRRRPAPPPPPASAMPRKPPPAPALPASFAAASGSSAATPIVSTTAALAAAGGGASVAAPSAEKHGHAARSSQGLPGGRPSLARVEAVRVEAPLPSGGELDELLKDKPARKAVPASAPNGLGHHVEPAAFASVSAAKEAHASSSEAASAHTSASASPVSSLSSAESDALAALTLAPAAAPNAHAAEAEHVAHAADEIARGTASEAFFAKAGPAMARATGGSELIAVGARRHRNVKLIFGSAAVVVVVCSVFALSTMRRRENLPAEKPKINAGTTDFAELARRLAVEQANAQQDGSETPSPSKYTVGRPTPRDPRRSPGRTVPSRGILPTGTSPPPLSDMSPDQKGVAERLREKDAREERLLAQPAGGGAKNGPAQADITRVINNNKAGIQTCYQRALMRDNSLKHGRVNVRLTVGISGKVKKVGIEASSQFHALEPCIREVVQRWAFPPASDEYDTEFPVVLQGNE